MALRLCVCGEMFDRQGREWLCQKCKKEKSREASRKQQASCRDQYKSVKISKKKIYNNPCQGLKYDDNRERKVPCKNKTGVNRFFCHECHSKMSDAGMYGAM